MRIVYVWELGGGQGHLGAALPLLRHLRDVGHEVLICTPAAAFPDRVPADFFRNWRCVPKRFTMPMRGTLLGHAEILTQTGGFFDEGNLLVLLRNWRALLTDLCADIVLCDFAPAAMLAAKTLNIARIAFDTGFFYPPDDAPFPVLDPDATSAVPRLRAAEAALTQIVNTCLLTLQAEPLIEFASLFRADDVMLINHAVLDCFGRASSHQFVGPIFERAHEPPAVSACELIREQDAERPVRAFAYLSCYYPGLSDVLDILASNASISSIVYVSGSNSFGRRWSHGPNLSVVANAVDLDALLPDIDVVICHGGVGTINRALSHGIPLFLLPMFREQELNANRICALGLGLSRKDPVDAAWVHAVKTLADDPDTRSNAKAFAKYNPPADLAALTRKVQRCAEIHAGSRASFPAVRAEIPGNMLQFRDLDVIFLSMDEPNAERNWAALLAVAPHALRVHGVKGFDKAHREAGQLARTERFVTVDADTVVDRAFFSTHSAYPIAAAHSTWCWSSVNAINGLVYGNGGVKIWNRSHLAALISHENAARRSGMAYDFCFHAGYSQYSRTFATTYPNGSPYQAFRAGFREAVKLGRDAYGNGISVELLVKGAHHIGCRRLIVWMSIGADVEHGLWAMLGARMGFMRNLDPEFDPSVISSFDWFQTVWREASEGIAVQTGDRMTGPGNALEERIASLGDVIRARYGLPMLKEWTPERSRLFKETMRTRRPRRDVFDTEQDM
ncbi:MAG: hypothetical protein EPN57_07060 [Paraburkholderia sp.]|nr:MAG: hypothetical protein EPN57_07060 [Paraburkholderia sp.]